MRALQGGLNAEYLLFTHMAAIKWTLPCHSKKTTYIIHPDQLHYIMPNCKKSNSSQTKFITNQNEGCQPFILITNPSCLLHSSVQVCHANSHFLSPSNKCHKLSKKFGKEDVLRQSTLMLSLS